MTSDRKPKFSSFTYAHLTTIVAFIAKKKGKKSRNKIGKREKSEQKKDKMEYEKTPRIKEKTSGQRGEKR